MNLGSLIAAYRHRADDDIGPAYFMEDAGLIPLFNEAEKEACIRARLLFDRSKTQGITRYAISPGQDFVAMSPLIETVDRAWFSRPDGIEFAIDIVGIDVADDLTPRNRTASRVKVVADTGDGSLVMWPVPTDGGVLDIHAYRTPAREMAAMDDEPEIHPRHHEGLVEWVLHRVWSRPQADIEDQAKAGQALARFTSLFGGRERADVHRKHQQRRRSTTRYGGIL